MARILVVEDEPGIALALEDDLRLEGHDIEVTGDGGIAITRARASAFDLILLDIMLAGKDGFDVLRELRRSKVTTPIVMLTARTQEAEKVLALESGADDYVTKPFSPRELRARVAAILRRTRVPDPGSAVLRIGDADVDFERAEIRREGVSDTADAARVQGAATVCRCEGPDPHARAVDRRGVGTWHLRERSRGGQPHRESAPEAGTRRRGTTAPAEHPRPWLPSRRVSEI